MSKRIEFLDLAKGICIILVVVFHITSYYKYSMPAEDFFKAFRMPLYFFLSGLFFKTYSGFWDFCKRKVNKLLIPFFFWYLLCSVCISLLVYHFLGVKLDQAGSCTLLRSLTNFIVRENFANSAIWFLLCLFEVNILFYLILLIAKRFFKSSIIAVCVMTLLCGGMGMGLWIMNINLPMYIDSSLSALPFFSFGYLIMHYTNIITSNKYDKFNIPIAIVLFIIVYLFSGHYSLKFNQYYNWKTALWVYPCGFMGTMGIIFISKSIKKLPIISWWGRYSIMILVTHKMLYEMFKPICTMIGLNGKWNLALNLLLTFSSYFILIPFMKKFMPHVTAQKDLIKV